MAWYDNIARAFTAPSGNSAAELNALDKEAQQFFAYKAQAIAQARANAKLGELPSLEDYRTACIAIGAENNLDPEKWNASAMADLSGQDLSGFKLSKDMSNLMDLDSDGAISQFYSNVQLYDATLDNCYVQPATSFNEQLAHARSRNSMTFDGMSDHNAQGEKDKFTFPGGPSDKITLVNVHGGEITFSPNSQVTDLRISGLSTAITVRENASIDKITINYEPGKEADDVTRDPNQPAPEGQFRILTLNMGKGAKIANSDLSGAIIDMASNLQGAEFQNVTFSPNIKHVDFTGATLKNVTISGKVGDGELSGVDFSGATIDNLKINGNYIKSVADLKPYLAPNADLSNITINKLSDSAKMEQALVEAGGVGKWSWSSDPNANAESVARATSQGQEKDAIPAKYYAPNQGRTTA